MRGPRHPGVAAAILAAACLASMAQAAPAEPVTAFTGCRILPAANAPIIADGTLVVRGTRIKAIGPSARIKVPAGARRVGCGGGTLLPAFWNSHVHFMEPHWFNAAAQPAEKLSGHMEAMLSAYGFAHVVDTGSELGNTLTLARRIASGEVRGPDIMAAGSPFVAPNGTPFYIEGIKFPELKDPTQARAAVAHNIANGAGAIKVMSVSLTREQPFPEIDPATLRAAVTEAHRHHVLVLTHPTNLRGIELAVASQVDVVLHTAPIGGPLSPALARQMVKGKMALTPTLKLWAYELAKGRGDPALLKRFDEVSRQQLAAFRASGGRVLFGTDVGYMTDYDPTDEYAGMAAAGMSARDIVAALTSAPAATFSPRLKRGRLARGYEADFVLLAADPLADLRNLTRVSATYRAGQEIYRNEAN